MIEKKYIGIAVVALVAVVGAAVTSMNLRAQEPQTLATVVAAHDAEINKVKYCDWRSEGITVQGAGVVTIPAKHRSCRVGRRCYCRSACRCSQHGGRGDAKTSSMP